MYWTAVQGVELALGDEKKCIYLYLYLKNCDSALLRLRHHLGSWMYKWKQAIGIQSLQGYPTK
jgi:hypothetical protein